MTFALLPVKDPRNAKQRLSGILTAGQREVLARAMYEEVLAALLAAGGLDRIAVVTSDTEAAAHARRRGVLVFEEREQQGHSHSADRAARHAREMGADSVLLLPIDVPLVTPEEIETLAAASCRAGLVIVPSSDGTGTNALLRTPPDAIESRFGPGSFRAHTEQARDRGITTEVMTPAGIVFDLDTPEDVAALLARAPECRIARLLKAKCQSAS